MTYSTAHVLSHDLPAVINPVRIGQCCSRDINRGVRATAQLKAVIYSTDRIFSHHLPAGGSPEPYAYETGFAVKWAIADQIAGKPELNYDPAKGQVRAPWIAWGPYFWADGVKGRKDGLVYVRSDFNLDGMHPGQGVTQKTTKMLMDFLKTDQTSRSWFTH